MEKNERLIAYMLVLLITTIYYVIGYVFHIDILKVFVVHKDGFSIGFVAILLVFVTTFIVGLILMNLQKRKLNNE